MPQVSVRKDSGEVVMTVCDSDLFGEKLKEGNLTLEIEESFYGGEEMEIEECLEKLKEATIANLVGSVVDHAMKKGILDSENVLEIEGVKHAQLARY